MELLLFLSALLSGLTGFVAGDRAAVPSGVERGATEIVAVAGEVAEAVSARPVATVVPAAQAEAGEPAFAVHQAPAADPLRVSERRLE